jgi:hypothetical protein
VLAALKHHPLPLAPVSLDSLADTPKTHLPRTPPPTPSIEPLDLYPASTESQVRFMGSVCVCCLSRACRVVLETR